MADTNIPLGSNVGLPSFASHTYGGVKELISGQKEIVTATENVGASTTLVAGSVVGRSSGVLAMANGTTILPCGILLNDVTTGVGVTTTAEVYKSGCFNPDALTWNAYYNTDALKKSAFEGSLAPEIMIEKPRFASDVDLP